MNLGFPGGSGVKKKKKKPSANAGHTSSIPGSEDPLEKQMATHFSTEPHGQREPGRLQFMELQKRHNLATKPPLP